MSGHWSRILGSMDNVTFKRRIEELYQEVTKAPSGHGARVWFARNAHVTARTVERWCNGDRPVSGPAIGLLEALEREANR